MIVAGFGFTSRATADSLAQALHATGHAGNVDRLASVGDKAMDAALLDLSQTMGVMISAVTPDALESTHTKTQSLISRAMRRTGSVAEAAALAAAGPGATLIVTRQISNDRMATCAIAKGAST